VFGRLLPHARDLLDELAEAFTIAVELSIAEPGEPADDEDEERALMDSQPAELPMAPDVIEADPDAGSP